MMYLNQSIIPIYIYRLRLDYLPLTIHLIHLIDHTFNVSKYNPLAGSSYTKLPKELNHPRKGLIKIQNIDDNEGF